LIGVAALPKLAILVIAVAAVGLIVSAADGRSVPCRAKVFHTRLVKNACVAGGQTAAKDVMKKFMADVMRGQSGKRPNKGQMHLTCNSCHTKLAPDYPLTTNGLTLYKQLGGF
jgi:hypothetical protein